MVNCINLITEMNPRFVLGRENVPCVAEVVSRSLKADCTDFYSFVITRRFIVAKAAAETIPSLYYQSLTIQALPLNFPRSRSLLVCFDISFHFDWLRMRLTYFLANQN